MMEIYPLPQPGELWSFLSTDDQSRRFIFIVDCEKVFYESKSFPKFARSEWKATYILGDQVSFFVFDNRKYWAANFTRVL